MSGEGHGDIPDSEDVMLYLDVPDMDASGGGGGGQPRADPPQVHRSGPTPAMKDAAGRSSCFPTTADQKAKSTTTIIMAGGDGNYKNSVKARSPEGHELHVLSERDRRKKMGCKFLGLQELLPRLTEKASKAQILDEAISYIKILEGNLEELEKKKMERIRASASKPAKAAAAVPAPGESSTSAAVCTVGDLQVVQENYSLPGAAPTVAASAAAPYLQCPFPPGFRTWSSPNVTVCLAGSYATINICTAPKRGLLNGITQVLHGLNLQVVHAVVSSEGNRRFLAIHAHLANGVPDQPLLDASAIEERFKRAAEEINVLCISARCD